MKILLEVFLIFQVFEYSANGQDAIWRKASFCEVTKNPLIFEKTNIEIEAIFAEGAHDSYLYARGCVGSGLRVSVSCAGQKACEASNRFFESYLWNAWKKSVALNVRGRVIRGFGNEWRFQINEFLRIFPDADVPRYVKVEAMNQMCSKYCTQNPAFSVTRKPSPNLRSDSSFKLLTKVRPAPNSK